MELPVIRFRVVCSKGTYIRTLCDDIGRKLGCGLLISVNTEKNILPAVNTDLFVIMIRIISMYHLYMQAVSV